MFNWKHLGMALVFAWFMFGGISHFTDAPFFVAIIPPWIGWHLEIVYISGVFEIIGAVGILIPRTRQLAGNCLLILVIAVTPANIHMWLNPELFPDIPALFLSVRLVVQVLLLWCIWWCTRMPALVYTPR